MLKLVNARPPVLNERYEILGIIDVVGGVWHYLAWDDQAEEWCTVQMVGFKHARDRLVRSRFERGVAGLMRLKHPHILKVIEGELDHPAHPYAVMEVTEAGTVAEWIQAHGPMPPYLAIDVMSQVCGALSAAHRAGLTHGNLRTDQILVDRLGGCKVTGFRGGSERQDKVLDIKAAGALLYTLVTGRAFDESRAEQLAASLSPSVGRAVTMTRKSRGGYADIATFSRDLEAAVLELPMPTGHVPPLAPADCALPDDPALIWDDSSQFDDLIFLARLAEDPDYQPTQMELDRVAAADAAPAEAPTAAAPAPKKAAPAQPPPEETTKKAMSAIPYVMGTAADNVKGPKGDDGPGYTFEEPASKKKAWDNDWQADLKTADDNEDAPDLEAEQRTDRLLMKAVLAGAGFLFLVVLGAFGYGASLVGEAQVDAEESGKVLVALINQESKLIYDMANAGADKDLLERSYFSFSDATNPDVRLTAAANFARVVDQQAKAKGLDPMSTAGAGGVLTDRIENVNKAYAAYASRRATWDQRAGSFPGVLPVVIGLRSAPP